MSTAVATKSPKSVANQDGVQVGDFFVCSWGYDQTNVDFYKVIRTTAKGIWVQQWQGAVTDDNGPQVHKVAGSKPTKGCQVYDPEKGYSVYDREATAPIEFHRTTSYTFAGTKHVGFSVNSFSSASKWDGTPEYETGSGWGH